MTILNDGHVHDGRSDDGEQLRPAADEFTTDNNFHRQRLAVDQARGNEHDRNRHEEDGGHSNEQAANRERAREDAAGRDLVQDGP